MKTVLLHTRILFKPYLFIMMGSDDPIIMTSKVNIIFLDTDQ